MALMLGECLLRLMREAGQIERWLQGHPHDRLGAKNSVRQSNRTDNESAKIATDKGVIQGYTAVAAVDDKHQIIVEAQAHGVGSEQELLIPVVNAMQARLTPDSYITDAGYYSKVNVQAVDERNINACIPDPNYPGAIHAMPDSYSTEPNPTRCGTSGPR
jgi:hypothetical protein